MVHEFSDKLKATAQRLGIEPEQIPRSIAIIMDGNGRWAQQRGLARVEGHVRGAQIVEKIVRHCVEIGIEGLTLYSFSIENWKRPVEEIDALMHLYQEYLVNMRPLLKENDIRLIHVGRRDRLPQVVQEELQRTLDATADNHGLQLGLALNYGGRTEIVDAVQNIGRQCASGSLDWSDIDEVCISRHLYTRDMRDPDLLIRTSNEWRISNFLLWQISYSEFYVTCQYWPDFDEQALEEAILSYAHRDRRYGALSKTGDQ